MPMFSASTDLNRTSISGVDRKIVLFDLYFNGHHAGYIQHLVRYWCEQGFPGTLDVVVSPKFVQLHSDVVNVASDYGQKNVNFVAISSEEDAILQSKKSSFDRAFGAFREWNLLCKYASLLEATHCLLMYFDSLQLPLALARKLPCPMSGIYFRPVFHYGDFSSFTPSARERFWQLRDKFFLSRTLRHSQFKTLFCLDPFVVARIKNFNQNVEAIHLADPVQIYGYGDSQIEKLREGLGIHPGRTAFLMFGDLRKRKGIHQLLDALTLLPAHFCEKLCLLLVGPIGTEQLVQTRIAEISQSLPIQVVKHDRFVPEREIQPYFQVADVILAPYQRHIGMSAILVRAAAAQKPVLSSNYGLMGELVKSYKLGIAVDSMIPAEIAKGLTQFLLESPAKFYDVSSMKSFAEQNTAERFASTIFQHI